MNLTIKKNIVNCALCFAFLAITLLNYFSLYGCIISVIATVVVVSLEAYNGTKKKISSYETGVSLSRILAVSIFNLSVCWFFKYLDFTTFGERFSRFTEETVVYVVFGIGLLVAVKFLNLSEHPTKVFIRYAALGLLFIAVVYPRINNAGICVIAVILNLCLYLIDLIGSRVVKNNYFVFVMAVLSNAMIIFNIFITKAYRKFILVRISSLSILKWSPYAFLVVLIAFIAAALICYELDKKNSVGTNDHLNLLLVGYNLIFFMLVDKYNNAFSMIFIAGLILFDIIIVVRSMRSESKKMSRSAWLHMEFIVMLAVMAGLIGLMISFVNGLSDIFIAVVATAGVIFSSKNSKNFTKSVLIYLTSLLMCYRFSNNVKVYVIITAFYVIFTVAMIALNNSNEKYKKDLEQKRRSILLVLLLIVLFAIPLSGGVACKGFSETLVNDKGVTYVKIQSENRSKTSQIESTSYYWGMKSDSAKAVNLKEDGSFYIAIPEDKSVLTVVIKDSDNVSSKYMHIY